MCQENNKPRGEEQGAKMRRRRRRRGCEDIEEISFQPQSSSSSSNRKRRVKRRRRRKNLASHLQPLSLRCIVSSPPSEDGRVFRLGREKERKEKRGRWEVKDDREEKVKEDECGKERKKNETKAMGQRSNTIAEKRGNQRF